MFSSGNDEILIEEVRQNTVLRHSKDMKHKDVAYKDEIWKNIAVKIGKKPCENFIQKLLQYILYKVIK